MNDTWPQRCKVCGTADGINFNVADHIWERVVPKSFNVVCLSCFDYLASRRGVQYVDHFEGNLYFAGEMGSLELKIVSKGQAKLESDYR